MPVEESLAIDSDTLTGVNDAGCGPPFAFRGAPNKVTLALGRPRLSPADIARLEAAMKKED